MTENGSAKLSEEGLQEFLTHLRRVHERDDQHVTEPHVVTHSEDAYWLKGGTDNPSHIGLIRHLPMKTVEFFLQLIPGGTATDLQRHVHESVHYVTDGTGWSEVGDQVVEWAKGDFVYTPPWIWHRHYAHDQDVHMVIIENSRILDTVNATMRESRGSVSFADEFGTPHDS